MNRRSLLLATLALTGALSLISGCGSRGGELRGSLLDFYDVEYSTVRARLYSSELAIEYVREDGEVPVRVTIMRDAALLAGSTFDLPARGDITGRVGDTDMPPLEAGEVTLEEFEIVDGAQVRGEFSATLILGDDTASLSGEFDTPLEITDRVEGYVIDFGVDDLGEDVGEEMDDSPE